LVKTSEAKLKKLVKKMEKTDITKKAIETQSQQHQMGPFNLY